MLGKTFSAAAALALLAAAPANAACTQANIGGNWTVFVTGASEGTYFWFKCTMAITTAGKIAAGTCVESDGQSSPATGSIHLAAPAACNFNGSIGFTKVRGTAMINQAAMSLDKQTVVGVGTDEGAKFSFNMIKIK